MSLIIGGTSGGGSSGGGGASDEEVAQIRILANAANSNATTALNASQAATTTANNAVTSASDAGTKADAAGVKATTATAAATAAGTKADTATNNAAAAVTTANSASTLAGTAKTAADGAVSTANTAKSTADAATTVANTAKSTADAAKAVGDGLSPRVTTVETKAAQGITDAAAALAKANTNTSGLIALTAVAAAIRSDLNSTGAGLGSLTTRVEVLEANQHTANSVWPEVTKVQLTTTYLAKDHEREEAFCTDAAVNQAIYARAGKWYLLSDRSLLTTDPTDPGTIVDGLMRGWSISGAENGEVAADFPGADGTQYFAPEAAQFSYMKVKGGNCARYPYRWERAQPVLFGALSETFKSEVTVAAGNAVANGINILLDMHNYGQRMVNGSTYYIGTTNVSIAAYVDFYQKLANFIIGLKGIWGLDLMNEPYGMPVPVTAYNYIQRDFIQLCSDVNNLNAIPSSGDAFSFQTWYAPSPFLVEAINGRTKGGLKYSSATSQWKQCRHMVDGKDAGITVKAGATYVLSFWYKQVFTAGTQTLNVNATANTGNTGAVSLATVVLPDSSSLTRKTVQITMGASQTKLFFDLTTAGAAGEAHYDDFNLTETGTVKDTVNWAFAGEVCTTTLMYNAAIAAIRATGCTAMIVVEHEDFDSTAEFLNRFGSNPDWWIVDSMNRTQPSFHYYFDIGHGGGYTVNWTQVCTDRMPGEVTPVLEWCKSKGLTAFFGEYGVPSDGSTSASRFQDLLEAFLTLLDKYLANGTYWATGRGFYSATSIQPGSNFTVDKAAMAIVRRHMVDTIGTPAPTEPANQVYYNSQAVMYNGQNVVYGA